MFCVKTAPVAVSKVAYTTSHGGYGGLGGYGGYGGYSGLGGYNGLGQYLTINSLDINCLYT